MQAAKGSGIWNRSQLRRLAFQVVFTLLSLNFLVPAATYLLAPERAIAPLLDLGARLGWPEYPALAAESGSFVWRTLAATNVLTLGTLCVALQWNVVRHYPLLFPLAFLKGATALAFAGQWAVGFRHPLFLAIALWDGLAVFLFLFFASRARAALLEERAL